MARTIDLELLLSASADDSFDAGIRIDTDLAPLAGAGGPVKPAAYEGGRYQEDWRWVSLDDDEPTPVIVIDNVPSQANRLKDALRRNRDLVPVPEFVLDLSLPSLPAHLPKRLSSLEFPHRNADAYLTLSANVHDTAAIPRQRSNCSARRRPRPSCVVSSGRSPCGLRCWGSLAEPMRWNQSGERCGRSSRSRASVTVWLPTSSYAPRRCAWRRCWASMCRRALSGTAGRDAGFALSSLRRCGAK